jgi:hypothetical protein
MDISLYKLVFSKTRYLILKNITVISLMKIIITVLKDQLRELKLLIMVDIIIYLHANIC